MSLSRALGMRLGRAQTGSLRVCYAEPLAGNQKSEISGILQRPKLTLREKNSWDDSKGGR